MSEKHVTHWLEAYHDGALSSAQCARVAAHLATCAACQAELQSLQSLSTLLHAAPPAAPTLSPDRFVAQVGLRLPRRPAPSMAQRAFETVWRLFPVGVLSAWTFLQALFIVGTLVMVGRWIFGWAPDLPGAPTAALWSHEFLNFSGTGLRDLLPLAARTLWSGGALGSVQTGGFMFILSLCIAYGSWLTSWWIRQSKDRVQ